LETSQGFISLSNHQLVVTNKEKNSCRTVPIEDIGYLILDNQQITFTQAVVQELSANNVAFIVCNEKHHPVTMLQNLHSHFTMHHTVMAQTEATEPLKKQLWKQTVEDKIKNQAALLKKLNKNYERLLHIAAKVQSGDSTNCEAVAAKYYWATLFDDIDFVRNRKGSPPNSALNYGYAILRAAVAKALMGSGLMPIFGIHHDNKLNAFCLADDIMEPYRPFVDEKVMEVCRKFPKYLENIPKIDNNVEIVKPRTARFVDKYLEGLNNIDESKKQIMETNNNDLTTEIRMELLNILTVDTRFKDKTRPLMVALSTTTASLAKCLLGEKRNILYPRFK